MAKAMYRCLRCGTTRAQTAGAPLMPALGMKAMFFINCFDCHRKSGNLELHELVSGDPREVATAEVSRTPPKITP